MDNENEDIGSALEALLEWKTKMTEEARNRGNAGWFLFARPLWIVSPLLRVGVRCVDVAYPMYL